MVTTGHTRRTIARALAAGLVDLATYPSTWAGLPVRRRLELVDRAEHLLAEDEYSVDLDDCDAATVAPGHLSAA